MRLVPAFDEWMLRTMITNLGGLARQLRRAVLGHLTAFDFLDGDFVTDSITHTNECFAADSPLRLAGVQRRDGSWLEVDRIEYLIEATDDPISAELISRIAVVGALMQLGDFLARAPQRSPSPELEFVRHLRNGVAHGNRFNFLKDEPRHPARFVGPTGTVLEIRPELHGKPVLFDFLGPADVCDLLQYIENLYR